VRYPKSPLCQQLLKALESPIVSSSANLQGEDACLSGSEACQVFLDKVDFVVDSGWAPMSLPSTIVDVTLARPTVLRQGTLNIEGTERSESEPS
jgi:L-threonylcarbamoyladenylate synthase